MPTRLILLNSGATRSSREGAFAAPSEALDADGRSKAEAARARVAKVDACLASPAEAALETAAALGLDAQEQPALRDVDHGAWSGLSLEQAMARDPQDLMVWIADPSLAAPGGESMAQVMERIAPWLATRAEQGGAVLAITHAQVMRAALAVALEMPVAATFRIDIAPLSCLTLSHNGKWRLQGLQAL